MNHSLGINVSGHLNIKDDLGNVLVDKKNAVHPENMAYAIAKGLAHEDNFFVYKMAFGNGGTVVDAANHITYNTPNDGQDPDANTWNSTLYNQTYYEIVDEFYTDLVGTGPGTTDNPSQPNSVTAVEAGVVSKVVIVCVLSASEPSSEYLTDIVGTPGFPESDFSFDEIGLFTTGLPTTDTSGHQDVDVGVKNITDDTGLSNNTLYTFHIAINGGSSTPVSITTPSVGSGLGGAILFGDLIQVLNTELSGVTVDISGGSIPTYGFLRFTSDSLGSSSAISLSGSQTLFTAIGGYGGLMPAVAGQNGGIQGDPSPAERMLTHVIFSPVLKTANRTFTIEYTLTITVARTIPPTIF